MRIVAAEQLVRRDCRHVDPGDAKDARPLGVQGRDETRQPIVVVVHPGECEAARAVCDREVNAVAPTRVRVDLKEFGRVGLHAHALPATLLEVEGVGTIDAVVAPDVEVRPSSSAVEVPVQKRILAALGLKVVGIRTWLSVAPVP